MNQIIASLRNQVQKIKCRLANLTNRVTYIETNCCNGGGETEIPDWQEQAYPQGSIVAHNGGIWRSDVDGNEDEPVECSSELCWELVEENFELDPSWLEEPIDGEYISGNTYYAYHTVTGELYVWYVITDFTNTDGSSDVVIDEWDNIEVLKVVYPFSSYNEVLPNLIDVTGFPESYQVVFSMLEVIEDNTIYKPIPNIIDNIFTKSPVPPSENICTSSTCSWTLLAEVNEGGSGGDFMTLNSENNVTDDWSIKSEPITFKLDSNGINITSSDFPSINVGLDSNWLYTINNESNRSTFVGISSEGLRIEDENNFFNFGFDSDDSINLHLFVPNVDIGVLRLPLSVNGIYADQSGNIEIGGGGTTPTLSEVLAEGNTSTNLIKLKYPHPSVDISTEYGSIEIRSKDVTLETDLGIAFGHNGSIGNLETSGIQIISKDINNNPIGKGLFSNDYFGANYDDNTYVQKKYVDDNFLPLPTEGTSGQVLTTDGDGEYTWEDVEVQTYLQSITGYDAGATQTLKNVNGVLTWITD